MRWHCCAFSAEPDYAVDLSGMEDLHSYRKTVARRRAVRSGPSSGSGM
jgi:hypothetical protein